MRAPPIGRHNPVNASRVFAKDAADLPGIDSRLP
jgi:hypothetical protein